MKYQLVFASCVIAGSALASSGWAQDSPSTARPAPGTSSLAHAVEKAWQRAVVAREAHGQRQRAEAEQSVASSLWAAPPSVELSHRTDRWQDNAGRRESEVALAWPLWLPGQRSARGAAAEAGVALADVVGDAARLRLAGDVREAAWAMVTHQRDLEQADAAVRSLQALADDVDRRVKAGDLARADALAARAELLGATAYQAELRQRQVAAETRWAGLTGTSALESPEEPAPPSEGDLTENHPELRAARQATEHARKRAELVRTSRLEPPELSLGYRQDEPGRGLPTQGSITIGLRVPFGTDDRNRPLQAAALAELDVAQTHEERLRERLIAEAGAARAALQAAQQQLALEKERTTMLRERADLIARSFRAGESALPDLLRATSAAAQADAALARQSAALGLARARLNQSLGILP